MTPDEINRRAREHSSIELIETTGDEALAKWQDLKSAGQGSPVVFGKGYMPPSFDDSLTRLGPDGSFVPLSPTVEDILRNAAGIRFPDDLAMARPRSDPALGEWPTSPNTLQGLSVAGDGLTGKPLAKVYIGLVPTDDWTTIPAYLRRGGWNECPAPEHHVAAMRTWRDRHGAELIGIGVDTINVRVAARPKTRREALAIAREHHIYCTDVIDQGVYTYRAHAADLMANDWWNFWWD
jgi:hypothetical protein